MARRAKEPKARLNLKIDPRLKEWARNYAERRGTDITKLLCEYLIALRSQEQNEHIDVEPI